MRIIVYQGDENRAKIEKELTGDIFFASVYARANYLVKEIVDETRQLKEGTDRLECSNSLFQRTQNNIITFCAPRGQGKTTAMKSFARFLATDHSNADFVVLDSIDPSALNGGESIVRVVLSRLFYKLEEKSKTRHDFPEKRRILELFQKCYSAIDYINGNVHGARDEDDLEELASLGSSSRLKKNLKELIDLLLGVYLEGEGKNGSSNFLVIPIDDVDICSADIYRCCEEIRNYLVLPNVIILMAADHEQLVHVMYQKYLQMNKELLTYEPENAKEECSRLASGYLLKLLPVNHIVELPEWDKMAEEEWLSLSLEYYIYNDNGMCNIFEKPSGECGDMRQQLGQLIFESTGIIIYDGDDNSGDYMPKTMRELTQLLKNFAHISPIDENILYGEDTEAAEIEADRLINNIRLYKRYFLDSWCMNHMLHEEYTHFLKTTEQIEKGKKNGKIGWTYRELLEYLCGSEKGKFKNHIVVDDAFCMFISIFLNEWLAEALHDALQKNGKSRQYRKIADFIGMKGIVPKTPDLKEDSEDYMVYAFATPRAAFPKELLPLFDKDKYFYRTEGDNLVFDVLNPWDYIIRKGIPYYSDLGGEGGVSSNEDREIRKEEWIAASTVISNINTFLRVSREYLKDGQRVTRKLNGINWQDKVMSGYWKAKTINWKTGVDYLEKIKNGMDKWNTSLSEELKGTKIAFMCNEYNKQSYYNNCSEKLKGLLNADNSRESQRIRITLDNVTSLPIGLEELDSIFSNVIEKEPLKDDEKIKELAAYSKAMNDIFSVNAGEKDKTVDANAEVKKPVKKNRKTEDEV